MYQNALVSIIVPVYNVEKYLSCCVESLINQTYRNIEIILVDDGSKDRSGLICDHYSTIDKRIKVLHQVNSGVCVARNKGLDAVSNSSRFLTFVDADDWLDVKSIELLVYCIEREKADMVIFNFYAVKNGEKSLINTVVKDEYTTDEIKHNILTDKWINFLWDKLYRTEIFHNIRMPIGHAFAEDAYIMPEVLSVCKKIVCIKNGLYYYNRGNLGNVTQNLNFRNIFELYLTWRHRVDSGYSLTDGERKICINLANSAGIKACYLNLIKPFLSETELNGLQMFINKRINKSPLTMLKAWTVFYKLVIKKMISRNYTVWVFWKNYRLRK